MSSQSAASKPPERLGWLILIPLGCLVVIQIMFAFKGSMGILDGALVDTDAYMRMVRVQELHQSGDWFDARLPRVNPPEGHVQHWTRPLDALLLGGALLLEPILGFDDALHLWGLLISPVCLALIILALTWATRPLLCVDGRLIVCLALMLQLFVMGYTIVGRPDHHSLLLLLFTLLIGLVGRLLLVPRDSRAAAFAGAVAALGVWISLEALLFVAVGLTALGLYWLLGDRRMATVLRNLLGATTTCLVVALVIERGPADLLTVEADRLSIVHVTLFLLLALLWTVVAARPALGGPTPGDQADTGPDDRICAREVAKRVVVAGGGTLAVGVVLVLLFPELRSGPLGTVDPFYARHRLERILEFQPLVRGAWLASGRFDYAAHRFLMTFGIGLFALPFLALKLARPHRPAHRVWVLIALCLAVYVPIVFYQQRWATYAQLVLVVPYAAFVVWLLQRIAARAPAVPPPLWRSAALAVALLWPIVVPQALPSPIVQAAGHTCPVEELTPTLNRIDGSNPKVILAFADYSPALLYLTPHSVLSIPNHRPQPGYTATYRILTSVDPGAARDEVGRRGIDWILLCPNESEQVLFTASDQTRRTLYRRLIAGDRPAWLQPLELPEAYRDDAMLFAVRQVTPPSLATAAGR